MPNREFTPSSGNVFADLNLPHADDLLAKAELAAKIIAEIQRRRLTQSQAAAILGIDQPKVSALKQGKLSGFSIERLMRFLLVLGRDIEITVKGRAKSRSVARLRVAGLSAASPQVGWNISHDYRLVRRVFRDDFPCQRTLPIRRQSKRAIVGGPQFLGRKHLGDCGIECHSCFTQRLPTDWQRPLGS